MRRWQIEPSVTAYIKYQIESGTEEAAKSGLQHLCKLYRRGGRVRSHAELIALEQSIVGLLYTRRNSEKLQRWALTAIAEIGRPETTLEVVLEALEKHEHDPQIASAAMAALYSLDKKANAVLRKRAFPPELIVLSALQSRQGPHDDLPKVAINIEKANPDILKLSLVAVGLDKAPENIFDPRYLNSEIVRVLGAHHDPIVSQYSIWAITENSSLTIKHLGVPLRDIERKPPNVRGWMYRLIALDRASVAEHLEYLRLGSDDREADARSGLAYGLRDSYFDGLEELVLDWFPNEPDREVRDRLIDHMVVNADRCPSYEGLVLTHYEAEGPGSGLRRRMDAAAAGKAIYSKLKRTEMTQGPGLFDTLVVVGEINMAKQINIGSIQGGAVSVEGDAHHSGDVSFDQRQLAIIGELAKAERQVHSIDGDQSAKRQTLQLLADAKADPSPSKLEAAVRGLKKVSEVAGLTNKTVESISAVAKRVIELGGLAGTLF